MDLFTLALAVDTSPLEAAASRVDASGARIKATFTGMDGVVQSHTAAQERVTQALAKTEAATRGLAASTRAASDPFERLKRDMAASGEAIRAHAGRLEATIAATRNLEPATSTAAAGFGNLQRPLQTAAIAMAGLPGPAGRVVSALGSFAVGGGIMLAATAGIAALSAAWERYSRDAREAEERTDSLIESLVAAHDRASGLTAEREENDLLTRLREVRLEIERALEVRSIGNLGNLTVGGLIGRELQQDLDDINTALKQFYTQRNDDLFDAAGKSRKDGERLFAERQSQLASLVDAELAAQEQVARARGDLTRADALAHEQRMAAIERQVTGAERLTTVEKDRLRVALQVVEATKREVVEAAELARRLAIVARVNNEMLGRNVPSLNAILNGQVGTDAQRRRGADLIAQRTTLPRNDVFGGGANGIVATLLDKGDEAQAIAEQLREARLREIDAMGDTRDAALSLVASLGVVPDSFLALADGLNRVLTDVAKRAGTLEAGLTTGNVLDLASLGVGLIGGILQARKQAEIEAAKFRAATADWERSLSRFAASIDGQSQLQKTLQDLEDRFLQLAEQSAARNNVLIGGDPLGFTTDAIAEQLEVLEAMLAKVAGTPIEEKLRRGIGFLEDLAQARELETKAIEAARKAFANQEYAYGQELEARLLSAQGRNAEAEALRLQERQRAELLEQQRTGYNAATLATLAHVQALEAEEAARQAAINTLNVHNDSASLARELQIRELQLRGDTPGAAEADIMDRAIKEFNRVQDLFRTGLISAADLQRWNTVIQQESDAAKAQLRQRIADAEAAIREYNRVTQDDLEVRRLRALGDDGQAERVQRAIDQERERLSFLAQGADAATIAILELVHGLETARVESDRLSAAERERLRQLEEERELQERLAKATADRMTAERRLMQDLDVRYLEALGQSDAADDLRRQVNNARELEEAVTAGMSPAVLAFLEQIQALERDRDLANREDRLAAALEPDPVARGGSTTSFDGRSITSAQADTMAAYLATIAINTGQLVRLGGGQPTQTARGAVTASGGALGGSTLNITVQQQAGETPGQALDRQLGSQSWVESSAAGTPPAI